MTAWAPVRGYEGLYSVSDDGRIRRDGPNKGARVGRILRPYRRSDGYIAVVLSKAATQKTHLIHRLLCEAFYGPRPGLQPNHKDGDKANNTLVNLEWASASENIRHAYATGLIHVPSGESHALTTISDATVAAIRESVGSSRQIAARFGIHHGTVWKIRAGRARKSYSE